jgi:mannose-1-phosphate guanylyltransferase
MTRSGLHRDGAGPTLARPGPRRSGMHPEPRWGLVLAGGDGVRLRALTRRIAGDERPKQFCAVLGQETLLEQTLGRATMVVPAECILAAVVGAHQRFYAPLLSTTISSRCMVIQPENRGSAPAILYGLLRLANLAAAGPLVVLPSDHYVSDDRAFAAHVDGAFDAVRGRPDLVVLLGIAPDTDDAEYGWIEAGEPIPGPWSSPLFRVREFWEKPSQPTADRLRARGCLWNSFVMVAYPSAFLSLMRRAAPALVDAFTAIGSRLGTPAEGESVRRLYARLPAMDFAEQILATRPASLAVLRLHGVGWSDLGAPGRVMATLARTGGDPKWARRTRPPATATT